MRTVVYPGCRSGRKLLRRVAEPCSSGPPPAGAEWFEWHGKQREWRRRGAATASGTADSDPGVLTEAALPMVVDDLFSESECGAIIERAEQLGFGFADTRHGRDDAIRRGRKCVLVDGALARGMEVYFQVDATRPPGLREEDMPRLPNGELPHNRMAESGSDATRG